MKARTDTTIFYRLSPIPETYYKQPDIKYVAGKIQSEMITLT